MLYSLDTSAILDGWTRYYPKETFPKLWERMSALIKQGKLKATEEVLHELKKLDDDALSWCKEQDQLFLNIDDAIQDKVGEILSDFPNLVDAGKGRSGADPFVIALAEINQCAVISGEVFTRKLERPRIPDVCEARNIIHGNLLFLIKQEGWKF